MLRRWFKALHREDDAQGLIEYTLLLAFLALASAGLFIQVGSSSKGVWSGANTTLDGAAVRASGTADTPSSGGSGGGQHGGHDGRH